MERDRWKDLERELHAARSEPPDALVATIAARLRVAGPRRRPLLRLAAAAVLTAGVLAVFAGLGAVDEAAGAAAKVAQVARALAGPPAGQGNQGQGNEGGQGQGNQSNQGGQGNQGGGGGGGGDDDDNGGGNGNGGGDDNDDGDEDGDEDEDDEDEDEVEDEDDGDETGDDGYPEKTAICHRTRSDTNPYVLIVVSNNAIPAHQAHDDPPDIIPAPSTGCPTTVP